MPAAWVRGSPTVLPGQHPARARARTQHLCHTQTGERGCGGGGGEAQAGPEPADAGNWRLANADHGGGAGTRAGSECVGQVLRDSSSGVPAKRGGAIAGSSYTEEEQTHAPHHTCTRAHTQAPICDDAGCTFIGDADGEYLQVPVPGCAPPCSN